MSEGLLTQFHTEYLQIPTESPEQRAVRELAEHCVDVIDDFDDTFDQLNPHYGGFRFPATAHERAACARFYRETDAEMFGYAQKLMPLDHREWRQIVLEATRRKSRMEWKRRKER